MKDVIAKSQTAMEAWEGTDMEIGDKMETFSQNPEEKQKRNDGVSGITISFQKGVAV